MLEATNLTRIYQTGNRNVTAVRDVNLALHVGTLTAIVGQSGSGKSTLLHLLAGLLTPTEGEVYLEGQNLFQLSDREICGLRNRKIGVIPQGRSILSNLNVLNNVQLPGMLYKENKSATQNVDNALELLDRLGIGHLAYALPNSLSGGELQRVAIARALINQPVILMADEPTSELDSKNTESILKILRQIADQGTAVLLVTHELNTFGIADTVYRMSDGNLNLKEN